MKEKTPKRAQPKRSLGELWRLWKKNLKEWRWYRREHPERFTLDIQSGVKKLGSRLRELWGKMRHLSAQKKAHKFPESESGIVQLFLFFIGSLPRIGAMLREKLLRRRKRRIVTGGRRRAFFDSIKLHPLIFLGSALGVAAVALALSLYTLGTAARYDGISLGVVANRSTADQAVTALEQVTRDTLGDTDYTVDRELLELKMRLISRKELESREELQDRLSQQIGLVSDGYMLYVDGEPVAATRYAGAMEELLEQLKANYTTPDTVECYFNEDVEIRQQYVDASYIKNLGYIAELLNETRQSEVTYKVKSGDVWSLIAERNGMTNKELLALNPGYDINNIHIGDVLTITNAVPYLTAVNVERQHYVKDVPYKIRYKDSSSMYQGDYKVLSKGKYGKADVTANVTYINGEEVSRQVVASVTLREPVTEVQKRGTKERPTWMPTGSFRWPCSGSVTSGFGYRNTGIPGASTYHKGLDIANSYGTAICAADGGTVSHAGWMGGYGYLVIIDHGNGYETYYGHNSSLLVSAGQHVYKGQQIACMGSTGVSSAPHCHFGVMINGTFVNPYNYL